MLLQYGVKIFVITSFKDPYCIEIIPKSRKPKQGKLVKPLIFVLSEDICSNFSRLLVGFLKILYFITLQESFWFLYAQLNITRGW